MDIRTDPSVLGHRVAGRRHELGLSRRQVARRAGMAEQHVRDIEERPTQISAATLWRLAAALELTPRRLLAEGPSALGTDRAIGDAQIRAGR
jgi:transcriptional regulator with XRE-family HTH domain